MIKVRIDRDWSRGKDAFGLWIFNYRYPKQTLCVEPIKFKYNELGAGFALPEPTMRFDGNEGPEMLRAFNDALIMAEIQSSKQDRRDKEMSAVKNHLADTVATRNRLLTLVEAKL